MLTVLLYPLSWTLSLLATILRLGAGRAASELPAQAAPLILYEFEGCPFCRVAREAVSASGVRVHVKPCPKGGKRFRPEVEALGGRSQFPFLIDPNTDLVTYESSDIAAYLRKQYGPGGRSLVHWLGPLNVMASQLAVLFRLARGTLSQKASVPAKPLEYWGAERSPGGRLVKELLCEKQLDYFWSSVDASGKGTPRLYDPNTDSEVFGAPAILRYLGRQYRA